MNGPLKVKSLVIIILPVVIAACSSASTREGYGPRGEGFIGFAYGYSDRQLGHGRFYVDYVDVYAEDARRHARRRAIELCVNAGFGKEVDFSPKIRPVDDLLIVDGIAQCRTQGQSETDQPSEDIRIPTRIAEIDAELLAYKRRSSNIQDEQSDIGNTGSPLLDLLGTVVGGALLEEAASDTHSRIIELESERYRLQTELLALESDKAQADYRRREESLEADKTGRARQRNTPSPAGSSVLGADTSAEGAEGGSVQGNAQQTAGSGKATPAGASSGGCMALMRKHESNLQDVIKAMEDHTNRTTDEYGFDGLGACGRLIIMRNLLLDAADVTRRCPEGDPTGEQLAAFERTAESNLEAAKQICSSDIAPRRYSMQELTERLNTKARGELWN